MITLPNLDCDVTSKCSRTCLHCNRMVGPYKFSGQPIPETTPAIVERDLAQFGRVARTKRWAALGGEPTLHKSLVDILHVVRQSGVADNIAVWTNGDFLRRMAPDFWRAFDTLVVSVYPGGPTDDDIAWIRAKCADEGRELDLKTSAYATRNWTRILEPAPTDDATTQAKYDACWFKTYCFALNFGHLFRCCTSGHIPQLFQGRPYGADGLCIDGLTEEALQTWLDRKPFMESCRVCCGRNTTAAVHVPWGEEKNPLEWVRKSKGLL